MSERVESRVDRERPRALAAALVTALVGVVGCGQQIVEFNPRGDAAIVRPPDASTLDAPVADTATPGEDGAVDDAAAGDQAAPDASIPDGAPGDDAATDDLAVAADATVDRGADATGATDAAPPVDERGVSDAPAVDAASDAAVPPPDQTAVAADATVGADLAPVVDATAVDLVTPPDQLVAGPRCPSVLFDGVHAIVSAAPIADYNPPGAFTLEAWVYPTKFGPSSTVIAAHWGNPSNGTASYLLVLDPTGKPSFTVSLDGRTPRVITSATPVPLGKWTHVAGVFDSNVLGTTEYVFNDGVGTSMGVLFGAGAVASTASIPLTVGRLSSSSAQEWPFAGYLDEVRLSNVARYTGNFTPAAVFGNDSNTVALYHFDEGSGTVAADSSSKGNPATLAQNAMFATPPVCN